MNQMLRSREGEGSGGRRRREEGWGYHLSHTVEKGAEEEREGREGEEYGGTTAGRGRAGGGGTRDGAGRDVDG